jgi:aspartate aminotransferase
MSMEKRSFLTSPTQIETNTFAERIFSLGEEGAFTVLAKAKKLESQGKSIIHLEIGEPDFDTPANIKQAAIASIQAGETHYTPSAGLMELRSAVAEYVSKTRGITVYPEEVMIAPGAKPLIFFAIMALVDSGDEVILPTPAYPTYESVIRLAGGIPVFLPLREQENFRFNWKELEKKITPKTKMLILNSPHNPTGGTLTAEDMEEVAFLSQKHGFFVLSDEIYSRIVYDTPFTSYFVSEKIKPQTILVDGFSKTYAMTGWRLGFGVMPKPLVDAMVKLTNNSTACTCTFVQKAGIEALQGPQDEVEKMIAEFKRRRDFFIKGLNEIPGFRCVMPGGAFYAFPNITGTGMKSQELSARLLEKAGVACLSGTAFGTHGEGYLRFSYANSIENLKDALEKIKEFLS